MFETPRGSQHPLPCHPCVWFLPGEWTAWLATRQAFHLYHLLDFITPRCSQVSPDWVFRTWQEHGIKYVADVLRVKRLSFFCWFAVSLIVLLCPGPLISSYPITLWGLEVCEVSFEHMTKLRKPGSVKDRRARLQKRLNTVASVAGDGRNRSQERLSQEVTDNDRCCKVLMSTGILVVEVQLS